jgi:hypothetical protein
VFIPDAQGRKNSLDQAWWISGSFVAASKVGSQQYAPEKPQPDSESPGYDYLGRQGQPRRFEGISSTFRAVHGVFQGRAVSPAWRDAANEVSFKTSSGIGAIGYADREFDKFRVNEWRKGASVR